MAEVFAGLNAMHGPQNSGGGLMIPMQNWHTPANALANIWKPLTAIMNEGHACIAAGTLSPQQDIIVVDPGIIDVITATNADVTDDSFFKIHHSLQNTMALLEKEAAPAQVPPAAWLADLLPFPKPSNCL
ncbi:UNVERIFIED_CONTAM: hypothetical protein HDU68_005702 [Siphonaria sp. JEL0065]|nr:hypothetical protein HDU68_005702 [Siphonaria sp. JEL0065]